MLERAIAILAVADELPEWHNQIPVASGLIDGKKHKRAAVDLVRMDGNAAEMVELKWKSDTPLYALFEVLLYGLVLLLCRRKAEKFGYCGLELIEARVVKLAVLAPSQYYDEYDCRKYADEVNNGLRIAAASRHPLRFAQDVFSFPAVSKLYSNTRFKLTTK